MIAARNIEMTFTRRPDVFERVVHKLIGGPPPPAVRALDDVSLDVAEGEVVALVGESGCGKSTMGRVLSGLQTPTSGEILFGGKAVGTLSAADYRGYVLAVQMIFQDALSSLNPRRRVRDIIGEAPRVHGLVERANVAQYVNELMARVGLDPSLGSRFPHQFSGGQRMRISIARALAVRPKVLVCDEVTASLDVSVQAQIINFFLELRERENLTCIFVSHDLGVVQLVADRVAVMYLGRIVELAPVEELFAAPAHPYTQSLLADVPSLEPVKRSFSALKGELPSPIDPPPGCHFHPRCPHAGPRCRIEKPILKDVQPGRMAACHLNTAGGVGH